jgi:DNA modification methylase/ParB-like chromosome segregation protein Spo0J
MPFCHPDKITIPPDRFRPADPTEIDAMAQSFKDVGQLQPILVDKDMQLTTGLHRLMTCKKLDREVWYETEEAGKLILNNPMLRRMAEYQENFRRKDFTPAEKNYAIAEIDRLMREIHGSKAAGKGISDGEWTQTDTAKKLGLKSHRTVSEAITVTKAIAQDIPGVKEAKTHQEAMSIVKTTIRMKAAEELAKRQSAVGTTEIQDPIKYFSEKIILGDCLEKMKQLSSGICSLFITDPPWKINMDKAMGDHGSAAQRATGSYDDSSNDIIQLLKDVAIEMRRVARPDAYVVMFCGIMHWRELADHFREVGFQVYNKPLVWVKTGNNNGLCSSKSPAPSMWPASVTDFMLLARKGNATLAQLHKGDAFLSPPCPTSERIHQAQKPIQLMEDIIGRFYHPGTNPLLIDLFCGSGVTLVAARRIGIKQFFGYELSPQNRDRAITYMVNCYMKEQEAPETTTINAAEMDEFE